MSHEKTIRETDEMDLSADRLPTKHASLNTYSGRAGGCPK